MAGSKPQQPLGMNPFVKCALNPGTLGLHDAADPNSPAWFRGDSPGSVGCLDHADPTIVNRPLLLNVQLRRGPILASKPDLSNVTIELLTGEDSHFGPKLLDNVRSASSKTGINPGFLLAVMIAEKHNTEYYTCKEGRIFNAPECTCPKDSPGVCSMVVGTDKYATEEDRIKAAVPASHDVKFAPVKGATDFNERGGAVTNVHFRTGRDATLGVAVYLKYGEIMLRRLFRLLSAEPIEVQWGLIRLAMDPGIGDAMTRVAKVRQGHSIFVKGKLVRGEKKPDTGMTIIVGRGLYYSEHFFGVQPD
jgi:hypothetical protein